MQVCLYLADGFEEIEAISVVDILRRASIDVKLISIMGTKEVVGAHNVVVLADELFEDVSHEQVDMMILPGGGQGTENLGVHVGLTAQISKQVKSEKWVAAICAAPTILGSLELLTGKKATCYPGCEEQLIGANISSEKVVIDGKIITSRGPGTSFAFALKIVEELQGSQVAEKLQGQMIIA